MHFIHRDNKTYSFLHKLSALQKQFSKNVIVLHSRAVHTASLNFLSCIVFVHKRCTTSKPLAHRKLPASTLQVLFIMNRNIFNTLFPIDTNQNPWHHQTGGSPDCTTVLEEPHSRKKRAASHAPPDYTLKPHDGKCTIQNLQKREQIKLSRTTDGQLVLFSIALSTSHVVHTQTLNS